MVNVALGAGVAVYEFDVVRHGDLVQGSGGSVGQDSVCVQHDQPLTVQHLLGVARVCNIQVSQLLDGLREDWQTQSRAEVDVVCTRSAEHRKKRVADVGDAGLLRQIRPRGQRNVDALLGVALAVAYITFVADDVGAALKAVILQSGVPLVAQLLGVVEHYAVDLAASRMSDLKLVRRVQRHILAVGLEDNGAVCAAVLDPLPELAVVGVDAPLEPLCTSGAVHGDLGSQHGQPSRLGAERLGKVDGVDVVIRRQPQRGSLVGVDALRYPTLHLCRADRLDVKFFFRHRLRH